MGRALRQPLRTILRLLPPGLIIGVNVNIGTEAVKPLLSNRPNISKRGPVRSRPLIG
jgi:hypothetical protein